uniref:Uncharacterized protein n=1 Tax=Callithrix jacchus TaxID=9483 RepID=A0A8I3WKD9_CALJA
MEEKVADAKARKQTKSENKLSRMTHSALEYFNEIGQGLKHLFWQHPRKSSISPHDVQKTQADLEPEIDLGNQNTCAEIESSPTPHPTALNQFLQQIQVRFKMKTRPIFMTGRASQRPERKVPKSVGNTARRQQLSSSQASLGLLHL